MGALGIVTFILSVAELAGMHHCKGKLRVRIVSFGKWLKMWNGDIHIAIFQRGKASIQDDLPISCCLVGWCGQCAFGKSRERDQRYPETDQ